MGPTWSCPWLRPQVSLCLRKESITLWPWTLEWPFATMGTTLWTSKLSKSEWKTELTVKNEIWVWPQKKQKKTHKVFETEKTRFWPLAVTCTCRWLAHFLCLICSYEGLLCGLCGDYDLNSKDDFQKPDGSLAKDANEFGHSWNIDPEWVDPSNIAAIIDAWCCFSIWYVHSLWEKMELNFTLCYLNGGCHLNSLMMCLCWQV